MQNWTIADQEQELAPKHKRLLREQTIDEDDPGTILRDFEALLDYIDEHQPDVTPKQRVLSLSALPEINERLTHPLDLGLKRPVQKSYPPIHGLYLVARASGLTRIEGDTLVVNEAVAEAWDALNATERYFALLESWLLRGNPAILGERASWFPEQNFYKWLRYAMRVPEQEVPVAGTDERGALTHLLGWHNLGLLDLFGLMEVQDAPAETGEGWHIERIKRTPFGDALLALLALEFFNDPDNLLPTKEWGSVAFGVLQPILQPYFPAWEKTLALPDEDDFQEGIYVFKVSLGRIWRRIAIPAENSLDALAYAILDAVAFDHDHLYQFTYRDRFGAPFEVHHSYMDEGPWTSEVRVGDLPLSAGQPMTFVYDFGDWWEFDVTLERIEPSDEFSSLEGTVVLEEHGEAPDQYRRWA